MRFESWNSTVPGAAICLGRLSREKLRRRKVITLFPCNWYDGRKLGGLVYEALSSGAYCLMEKKF